MSRMLGRFRRHGFSIVTVALAGLGLPWFVAWLVIGRWARMESQLGEWQCEMWAYKGGLLAGITILTTGNFAMIRAEKFGVRAFYFGCTLWLVMGIEFYTQLPWSPFWFLSIGGT